MKLTCPTCQKKFDAPDGEKLKEFPFCSDICRMADLGRWFNEEYYIPGERASIEEEEDDAC